jgi:hypothetical protein
VTKIRERVAMSKQRSQILYRDIQSQEVNKVKDKEKYLAEVSNRFAPLEDLDAEVAND